VRELFRASCRWLDFFSWTAARESQVSLQSPFGPDGARRLFSLEVPNREGRDLYCNSSSSFERERRGMRSQHVDQGLLWPTGVSMTSNNSRQVRGYPRPGAGCSTMVAEAEGCHNDERADRVSSDSTLGPGNPSAYCCWTWGSCHKDALAQALEPVALLFRLLEQQH